MAYAAQTIGMVVVRPPLIFGGNQGVAVHITHRRAEATVRVLFFEHLRIRTVLVHHVLHHLCAIDDFANADAAMDVRPCHLVLGIVRQLSLFAPFPDFVSRLPLLAYVYK